MFCICEPYSKKKEDKPVDLLMFSKQISWKTSKYVENYLMVFIKVSDILTFPAYPITSTRLTFTTLFLSHLLSTHLLYILLFFLLIVLCPIVTKNHFFKCYLIIILLALWKHMEFGRKWNKNKLHDIWEQNVEYKTTQK